ncbi:MAG: diguanylate cyclase [Bdellovibrionales bacterium]|nr:diguanylate cyclase [Bdellovibrionales bacterium]
MSSKQTRVLLVEDEVSEASLYADTIREAGECDIDILGRIEGGIDQLVRFNYQLVVIDGSKSIPAIQLLENIKRIGPMIPVILISDRASVEEAVQAMRLGADDYFQKPLNLDVFRLSVRRALDRALTLGGDDGQNSTIHLLHSCQVISSAQDPAKIYSVLHSYFNRELKSPHSAVYRLENGQVVREATDSENISDRAMVEVLDIALAASSPTEAFRGSDRVTHFAEKSQLTPGLFIFQFHCVGDDPLFFVTLSPEVPRAIEAFESRVKMLKTQIEVTGRSISQFRGVQSLAYVDDATGLYNMRYFQSALDRVVSQADQSQKPFAILFIDADHFKNVNDSHGHLVGTRLLHDLGLMIKNHVRDTDTVFRYGGDEFVAILSPCDLKTAEPVAERIRKSVEKTTFIEGIRFTVSIGIAIYPDHAQTQKSIVEAADRAMYGAKRKKRNCVFVAGPDWLKQDEPTSLGLKVVQKVFSKKRKKKS